jgi:ribosomal protein S12 methylthiotransferase accessory factor
MANSRQRGDLRAAASDLVSERTGIVATCGAVVEDPADPERPYFYVARLSNYAFKSGPHTSEMTSGKGATRDDAFVGALGEALERYSASIWKQEEVVHCRRSELPADALDPRGLVLYADEQYRDLRYVPYSENAVIGWIRGYSLGRGAPIYVPALAVFMNYVARRREEHIFSGTSSGLALAPSLIEAILGGAWEVIERDAYMIAWFNRLSCRAIAFDDHPDPAIADVTELLRRRGVDVRLFQLPTDRPCHVMLALALTDQVGEPAAIVGLGSHPDPALAAQKAILELGQIRPGLRRRLRDAGERQRLAHLLGTRRPQVLMDHALLYAAREMLPALDFLLKARPTAMKWDVAHPPAAADQLHRLMKSLTDDGTDLIYVNLTPPELERRGLFTTRVIIPGSQPIDFGDGQRRFGGARLYDLPVKLGFARQRPFIQDLNPDPHPMA